MLFFAGLYFVVLSSQNDSGHEPHSQSKKNKIQQERTPEVPMRCYRIYSRFFRVKKETTVKRSKTKKTKNSEIVTRKKSIWHVTKKVLFWLSYIYITLLNLCALSVSAPVWQAKNSNDFLEIDMTDVFIFHSSNCMDCKRKYCHFCFIHNSKVTLI